MGKKPAGNSGTKKRAATKSQILHQLATETALSKKQVEGVLSSLEKLIKNEVGKKGPGTFTLPGLIRLRRAERPATPAKMGRNPRTGEPMQIPAKPKRTVVRARVLKALNESVK
jgi:nucleoid DNA-binding protein